MTDGSQRPYFGFCAMAGGALGLFLAPVMVTIKYMTGWTVIREPFWVALAQQTMGGLLQFAPPPKLWMVYGSAYTIALLLMFAGLIGLSSPLRDAQGRVRTKGYWILIAGFCLVIPSDAIHTWTWSQNGLTIPTPGTNPLANTAFAFHMLGMNIVMVGSMIVGVSALRKKLLAQWLAWSFILVFPSAVLTSITLLPTTPSGALWMFSGIMVVYGSIVATGRTKWLVAA